MKKNFLNYWIDLGLLISFLIVAITGIIKFPGLGLYQKFGFSNITKLHDLSGIGLIILVLVHLILHWNWIVSMTKLIFNGNKGE
jgi:hypothetical protein